MRIRRMEEDCYSTQLIERDGEFNVAGLEQFMRAVKLAKFGLSYAVVSIMGPQGSGKSTLLNHLFGTNFREMDAFEGRNKTTNGIWIAKAVGIEPCTIVLDLEGTDGREREDDTAFEKQSALFALAISDVVLINMWCHDIGREQAANKPLLKTVFQVMMRLFNPRKITLLFVIRDKTKTPMEHLEPVLREDIQKIWDTVSKTQARKDTALSEYFNVEVTALPSYEEKEKQFKEQVAQLRQRFFHSIAPGGLAGDRRGVIPASGFSFSAQQIWKVIRENKDLDLPAHKVMVATFRCEQIAHEKFSRLISDEGWLELEKAIQSGPVPGFGEKLSSILDAYLSEYDMEAIFFDEHVRTAKKKELESRALDLVHPAFQTVLGHLRFKALEKFKIDLDQSLKSGKKFAASVRDCTHSSMLEFDRECLGVTIKQANWDTSKTKEKLRRDIEAHVVSIRNEKLSELKTNYEKQLTEALAKPVESLFYSAGQDTWASIRQLYKRETENALSRFSTALSGFELDQTTYDVLVTNLNEFARSVVENKAREEAGKVLIRMKDRFSTVFSHDKNSMPRVWTGKENIQMITKDADVSALKLLSVMAAIRLDEKPDKIESILNSTLLEGPVSKDRSIEASTNLLASNTWEEVPPRNTLITPLQCIDIWKQFKAETEYNIYQAIYAQEALRRNKNWLPPPWAIIALAILGFDEFMMLLRNPRYPLVLFVIFLLSTALWVQLDITGAFRNGMLSGILLVSSRFLLKLSGILLLSSRFLLKVMSFLRRLAYLGQRQHEAPQPPRRPPPRSSRSFRSQSQSQAPLSNSVPDSSSSSATIASRNDVESSPLRRRQVGESDAGSSALQVVQH